MFDNDYIKQAANFASAAHRDQVRKYVDEPYFNHCKRVAENLTLVEGLHLEMIAAALLHDTVEDTNVTLPEIAGQFGVTVARYVFGLTKISKPSDGNREARTRIDHTWFWMQPKEIQTIKCADVLDNVTGVVALAPDFAKTYVPECADLIGSLHNADPLLRHIAQLAVKREREALRALE